MKIKGITTDYKETIGFLKQTQLEVKNKSYLDSSKLEDDFNKSISKVWNNLADLKKDDLTNLYEVNSFLIEEVVRLHESENNLVNEKLMKTNIDIRMISNRLEDAKRAFDIYAFNDASYEYYLIGDIHSDVISLERILETTDFFNKIADDKKVRLIFIGDYVDRGASHLKLLQYILTLKYLFPKNVFLQKGNHDVGTYIDGEVKMGVRKPEKDSDDDWFLLYLYNLVKENTSFKSDIIDTYLKLFNSLGIASFISGGDTTLMVAHAGIPRPKGTEGSLFDYIESISDLTNENLRDHIDRSIVGNIIWSDPTEIDEDLKEERARFKFTQSQFEEFRNFIGFDKFIRGHQVETEGYRKLFDDRFITIFSSGKILKDDRDINTDTAYTRVNPHIIRFINDRIELVALND